MEIEKEGLLEKTQERELLEKGKNCFFEIVKSYRKMIRTIKQDDSEENKYPMVSSLKVQTEITKITQNFEKIQIILNESMTQHLLREDFGRSDRFFSHRKTLEQTQKKLNLFLTTLEYLRGQGEGLLAECESATI
ncbi:hypothetical protein EHI8A_212050 [Entamoeba histolytica HM-1:IMSS-B]|uniref:Uncharacterized protein n=6 Tax=Entamoeba histolytica TaxID=5759 RepID=C4M2H8_ENTH1|nr:hypothetical protein EHI_054470 [Entamoeba histolytica HM-1:IMSS]EMD46372.1 Hypothetical protein EHI5A_092960 [Entamoeba histolytica KU27]EMH72705.1 hypothetical protein EHI8A_212050 [Entamoeba histolytica HM-1:IMSS-B]EMS17792.1 hypothetical protein KM1_114350 [Entamoeba histolytica HM-3:IMSS]ENY60174.1 hypothetical protein EHI7A_181590 [Entamoeba histolytica HM-1:IMSS-A]GAT95481.1 hypothetical protein CL6EHI_054470 [Entamoeba histolytica]|eukprot:XP_652083.1 hypothetical protein EHI_054470 [Entamoeba histolytica HM-1:IMSS]